ncbi:MAG: hypothetical protein GC165_18290 [Armatimonadetes bacterium]|nr:hypothetical protein [Armatimonadota bacterium]MBS1726543.1 hypothetical protein [Armatimonadota bacterium]
MRVRNRKRGVTYVEVVVASAFLAACAATVADSLAFSMRNISYAQRRSIIQAYVQSVVDATRSSTLTALPADSTSTTTVTLVRSRTVTITKKLTQVTGLNLTLLQVSATWQESRGSRFFTDSLTYEVYLRGPDNA